MSLTFNDGSSDVLVLPDGYSINYNSKRENMVLPIQMTSTVQGMDMIATTIKYKVTGLIYINPHSSYNTLALLKAAFVALHPGSSKTFSVTDSDSVWTESTVLMDSFTLDATERTPNGYKYSIDYTVITTALI